MGVLLFRGEAPVVCLAQPNGLGLEKDCHSGATPRPFAQSAANGRGVAPLVVLHYFPARRAGLGKRRGFAPEIRKDTVLTYQAGTDDPRHRRRRHEP